jgi:hypothetical protein
MSECYCEEVETSSKSTRSSETQSSNDMTLAERQDAVLTAARKKRWVRRDVRPVLDTQATKLHRGEIERDRLLREMDQRSLAKRER